MDGGIVRGRIVADLRIEDDEAPVRILGTPHEALQRLAHIARRHDDEVIRLVRGLGERRFPLGGVGRAELHDVDLRFGMILLELQHPRIGGIEEGHIPEVSVDDECDARLAVIEVGDIAAASPAGAVAAGKQCRRQERERDRRDPFPMFHKHIPALSNDVCLRTGRPLRGCRQNVEAMYSHRR